MTFKWRQIHEKPDFTDFFYKKAKFNKFSPKSYENAMLTFLIIMEETDYYNINRKFQVHTNNVLD